MSRHPFAVLVISGLFVLAARPAAAEAPYQNVWDRYTVMLWPFKVPPPGPAYKKALDSINLLGTQLNGTGGHITRDRLKFVLQYRIPYYVGHAASKGYLYLKGPDKAKILKKRHPVARPHCLSNPATIAAMKKAIKNNVTAAKVGRCLAYAFDDEISATSFTSPADTCTSPWCLKRFRAFLKDLYGTIEKLNAQWETQYTSFDQISIVGCEKTRLANYPKPLDQWNLSGWVDSREFVDKNFADTLEMLVQYTNQLDPARPAGYVGGGGPTAYGGYDYEKICKVIQWIEAYDIGGSMEIIRSLMPKYPTVQTWFHNGSVERNKWFNWYYWAHGGRGQIIWPENGGKPWFAKDGTPRPDIKALAPMLKEIQSEHIGKLLVDADFDDDRIALYYGQPSIRVSWFIDIIPHKATWPNRSSSINNKNDTSHWNRYGWMKALEDAGLQYNFVTRGQIAAGELIKKGYKVLILGRALALSDAEAEAIKKFVEAGGWVIADHLCGIFDEHGKARAKGALDDLFGVSHDLAKGVLNGKVLYEIDAERHWQDPVEKKVTTAYDGALRWQGKVVYERGLKATTGKPAAKVNGIPVVVRNGRAIYLNLSPIYHCVDRYDPKAAGRWPGLITSLVAEAGIKPRARVLRADGRPEPIAECIYWRLPNGRKVLCVVKNVFRQATISSAGKAYGKVSARPTKIRIEFAAPVKGLKNERTGRVLGDGVVFEDSWITCEANVYSFE